MSIVRVGTTKRYADGWEAIFGGKPRKAAASKARARRPKARKKSSGRKRK